jgi:hypothetical protein
MNELSPTTKALLRAARQDGPSAAGRSQIWNGVAAKAAGKVALGAAGGKAASAATAKLFVMGALLGSAVTVGVAGMVLHVGTPTLHPESTVVVRADTETAAPAARTKPIADEAAPAPVQAEPVHRSAGHARPVGDSLGHEARLVEEARGAVMRGQPDVALSALRAAQALPGHALEPEELSLEVRALRALGRLDEANAADAKLKARFPDHALAR